MIFFFFIAFITCLAYVFIINAYSNAWKKEREFSNKIEKYNTFLSIVIPVRNEEKNICKCLESIKNQNFPNDLFEIIVINDDSTDLTFEKTNQFIAENPELSLKLISLQSNIIGKKRAIQEGIRNSKGELILTTDGDCEANPNWISTIVSFYETEKPEMIIAPVVFHNEKNIFEKIQSLEFLSLIGSAGSSAILKNPILCNGANLAYSKSANAQTEE